MRSFAGYPVENFIGTPYGHPINICAPFGGHDAKVCPITIQWDIYGAGTAKPNLGVSLNLYSSASIKAPIDRIAALYIDNTESENPVFIVFPDTGFIATCNAFSSEYIPVITGTLQAIIYTINYIDEYDYTTRVFFLDKWVPGFVTLERNQTFPNFLASPSRGGFVFSPGFGSASLGDEQFALSTTLINGYSANILNTPNVNEFMYFRKVMFRMVPNGGSPNFVAIPQIYDVTNSITLFAADLGKDTTTFNIEMVFDSMDYQIAKNTELEFRVASTITSALWRIACHISYTDNLN